MRYIYLHFTYLLTYFSTNNFYQYLVDIVAKTSLLQNCFKSNKKRIPSYTVSMLKNTHKKSILVCFGMYVKRKKIKNGGQNC